MQTIPPETQLFQKLRIDVNTIADPNETAILFPTIVREKSQTQNQILSPLNEDLPSQKQQTQIKPIYTVSNEDNQDILNEQFVLPVLYDMGPVNYLLSIPQRFKRFIADKCGDKLYDNRVQLGKPLTASSGFLNAFSQFGSTRIRIVFSNTKINNRVIIPGSSDSFVLESSIFTVANPVTALEFASFNKLLVGTPSGVLVFSLAVDETDRGHIFVTNVSAIPISCGSTGYVSTARALLAQKVARRLLKVQQRMSFTSALNEMTEEQFITNMLENVFNIKSENSTTNLKNQRINRQNNEIEVEDEDHNEIDDNDGNFETEEIEIGEMDNTSQFNKYSLTSAVLGSWESLARSINSAYIPTSLCATENCKCVCVISSLQPVSESAHILDLVTLRADGVKIPIVPDNYKGVSLIGRAFKNWVDYVTCCSITQGGELIAFGLNSGSTVLYDTVTARSTVFALNNIDPKIIEAEKKKKAAIIKKNKNRRIHGSKSNNNNNNEIEENDDNRKMNNAFDEEDESEFIQRYSVDALAFSKTTTIKTDQTLNVLEFRWLESQKNNIEAMNGNIETVKPEEMGDSTTSTVSQNNNNSISELGGVNSRLENSTAAATLGLKKTVAENNLNDSLFGSLTDGKLCCTNGGKLMIATSKYREEEQKLATSSLYKTSNENGNSGDINKINNEYYEEDDNYQKQIREKDNVTFAIDNTNIDQQLINQDFGMYNNNFINNNANNFKGMLGNLNDNNNNIFKNDNMIVSPYQEQIVNKEQNLNLNLMCPETTAKQLSNVFLLAVAIGSKVYFVEIDIAKFSKQASWVLPIVHLNTIDASPVKLYIKTAMTEKAAAQMAQNVANFAETRILGGNITDLAWKDGLLAIATVYEDYENMLVDASVILSTSLRNGAASRKISTITQGVVFPNKIHLIEPGKIEKDNNNKLYYSKYREINHVDVCLSDTLGVMVDTDGMIFKI